MKILTRTHLGIITALFAWGCSNADQNDLMPPSDGGVGAPLDAADMQEEPILELDTVTDDNAEFESDSASESDSAFESDSALMNSDAGVDSDTTDAGDTDSTEPTDVDPLPETIFNQPDILEYRFDISQSDYEHLEAHGDDEEYVPVTLTVVSDDIYEHFEVVGIRHKGAYSLRSCFEDGVRSYSDGCAKISYKVKFSKYDEDTRFYGYKRINLHAMSHDDSKLREQLTYGMFNEFGVDAPQTAYANVYINDELIGLFLQVEQIDGRYTAFHYPQNGDGNLYKERWPKPGLSDEYVLGGLKTNDNPEDNPDVSGFHLFGDAVGNCTPETFETVMADWVDLENILRYMAVDRASRNWDGIVTFYGALSPHNFYWYQEAEPGGICHLIPWDLDNTFWSFDPYMHPEDGWVTAAPVPDWNVLPFSCDPIPLWTPDGSSHAIPPGCDKFINLLAATGWDRFASLGEELLAGPFALDRMTAKINGWVAQIDPAVAEDPSIDYEEWKENVSGFTTILASAIEDFQQHLTEGYIIETECKIDSDCLGGTCEEGACVASPPTCVDGLQNGNELGVDCGGPDCDACGAANTMYFEAESGVLSGSPTFEVVSDSAASGGEYLAPTSLDADAAGPNRATYRINVLAGTYALWGRVFAPSANADSLWVSMDGAPFVNWNSIPALNLWRWDDVHNIIDGSPVTYELSTGFHTLVIANREEGVKLDRLYLTAIGDRPTDLDGDATCDDGILNQYEVDVDCGGRCIGCPVGAQCNTWLDCLGGFCSENICVSEATCFDGMLDGNETDVDCGGPDCSPCAEAIPTALYIQAEAGRLAGTPGFEVTDDPTASGGQYILPTSNDGYYPGPNRASYTFTVAAGAYVVWVRVVAPNSNDDSLWVRMDDGVFIVWNSISGSGIDWNWDKVNDINSASPYVTYNLSAGIHTLEIANREDGVQLDRLYITSDGDTPEP